MRRSSCARAITTFIFTKKQKKQGLSVFILWVIVLRKSNIRNILRIKHLQIRSKDVGFSWRQVETAGRRKLIR